MKPLKKAGQKQSHTRKFLELLDNYSLLTILFLISLTNVPIYFIIRHFFSDDKTIIGLGDSSAYINLAKSLLSGNGYNSLNRPPLYPIVIMFPIKVFGENLFVLFLINVVFHAVVLLLLIKIARKIFSGKAYLILLTIFLIYPHFIYQVSNVLTESMFMLLSTAVIAVLVLKKINKKSCLAAGILSGLTTLARPNFLICLTLVCLYLLFKFYRQNGLKLSLIYLTSSFITILPWTTYNYFQTDGKFILVTNNSSEAFWLGNSLFAMESFFNVGNDVRGGYFGIGPEELRDVPAEYRIHPSQIKQKPSEGLIKDIYLKQSLGSMKAYPKLFAKLYWIKFSNALKPWSSTKARYDKNMLRALISGLAFTPILIFGLIGIFLSFRNKINSNTLLLLPVLSGYLTLVIFFPSQRFRVPLADPFLMVFASYAITVLYNHYSSKKRPPFNKSD